MNHSLIAILGLGTLALPSSAQTLVARYALNESTGTVCVDSSGNSQDGTYRGNFTLGQGSAGGACATSVGFDQTASTDVVIPGGTPLQSLTSDLTLSAWINPDSIPTTFEVRRIFGNDDGGWTCGLRGNGLLFTTRQIQDYALPNVPIQPGAWTHVAFVFDSSFRVTYYVNGISVGSVLGNAPAITPNPDWFIGGFNGTIEFWDGLLDDIQVYSGSLTPAQVADLASSPCSTVSGSSGIGTNYCTAVPNITGAAGQISASGSNVAAANNVTLMASSLPPNQFGIFIVSSAQAFVPGGNGASNGNICVGGAIGRYNRPGQILGTGTQGEISLPINLSTVPQGNGFTSTVSGSIWNFQAWHRSPVGLGSNFTDGLTITFN